MEEKNRKMANVEKEEYTFDNLLNDILSENNESDMTDNNARCEYGSKLVVIQMLIGLANSYKAENYEDDEKLNNAIEIKMNDDELLSGYMFYISQNSQFDYSWNYMRKCKANYKEFLANTVHFLNNVLFDINMLTNKLKARKDMHVIFHDILDVRLISEKPYVKTHLLWENFYRLATVKSEYNVTVKVKESVLQVGSRKKSSDMEKFIDTALKIVKNNTSLVKL